MNKPNHFRTARSARSRTHNSTIRRHKTNELQVQTPARNSNIEPDASPDTNADADRKGVVYMRTIRRLGMTRRIMVLHALAHQGLERITLSLNVRLKSPGLTEGFVPVQTSAVSLRDLKHDLSLFTKGNLTDQIGVEPHQPVRDSSAPPLPPSPYPHRGGLSPDP